MVNVERPKGLPEKALEPKTSSDRARRGAARLAGSCRSTALVCQVGDTELTGESLRRNKFNLDVPRSEPKARVQHHKAATVLDNRSETSANDLWSPILTTLELHLRSQHPQPISDPVQHATGGSTSDGRRHHYNSYTLASPRSN
jgi:hypothetical protein